MIKNASLLLYVLIIIPTITAAQGLSLNTTGAAANNSAMLDVSSTSKGILIPRMTSTQRTTGISSPVQGLMVYQTDPPQGFYYFDGSAWNYIGTGSGTVTSVSSGNLSPIFTSTVTTSTTTPSVSYSLSNASAHSFLGNNTSSSATPTYTTVGPSDLTNNGGTTDSTKFYRGDGKWAAPIAIRNIRTVTSNTTLLPSDQMVMYSGSSIVTLTLPLANSVAKGSQISFSITNSGTVLVAKQTGNTLGIGTATFPFWGIDYYLTVISDGNATWYILQAN